MRGCKKFYAVVVAASVLQVVSADPVHPAKVLGSQSCSTSGCHGGAGPNRGAYTIWKEYDPHANSSATLTNGRSRVMAEQMGLPNAEESQSCTACHAPMRHVDPAILAPAAKADAGAVSCANCHGAETNWLLSHTRPDYPRDALAQLGMRQLGSAYQRANNCVACHQNLSDELVAAKHPPLVFELDGLLVAEPKHWREDKGFSHTTTWLVGQAVALRETAAQASREPGERRDAETAAIRALLDATGTKWDDSRKDLVPAADEYAKRISATPIDAAQTRAILSKLLQNRAPFQPGAFASVAKGTQMWAVGFYAERLALAIDRLNESLVASGNKGTIPKKQLDELFDAARPPKSFDGEAARVFLEKLDRLANSNPDGESR